MSAAVSSAILLREATRTSRRWQTYALRTAFSAALLTMVLATVWAVSAIARFAVDPANMGYLGRGMFVGFAVVQVLLAALIAPFSAAQAIIEERDESTLDLLALTRLTPRQILGAKVTSRVLTLVMVILGALPVLGMIVSLGGVSIVEVVAVTTHAVLTVVLLGLLGAFFGQFTRSPILATLAALTYTAGAYIVMPLIYGFLVLDWHAFAQFSPLMGTTATNAWALLPVFAYLPPMAMIFVIGARLFALRVGTVRLRRYFNPAIWSTKPMLWLGGAVGAGLLLVVPPAAAVSWYASLQRSAWAQLTGHTAWLSVLAKGASRAVLWCWCAALLFSATWLFLRIAMDMVMMADDLVSGRSTRRRRDRRGRDLNIWRNPVAWRAIRPDAWKVVLPALTTWMLVLLAIFQTGIWVIPGGLLGLGALNAAAAIIMSLWLAASAITTERRTGTLEILLTTTLSSARVVWGHFLGAALPSVVLMALAIPLILLGVPHLYVLRPEHHNIAFYLGLGVLGCVWVTALWLVVVAATLVVSLRLSRPRAAPSVVLIALGLFLLLPPVGVALIGADSWLSAPFRLAVPVLVASPRLWEIALSSTGLLTLTALLLAGLSLRIRTWALHD